MNNFLYFYNLYTFKTHPSATLSRFEVWTQLYLARAYFQKVSFYLKEWACQGLNFRPLKQQYHHKPTIPKLLNC